MGGSGHRKSKTLAYIVWRAMLRRCNNPKDDAYEHYGGRGITVCKRWHTFENFLIDMGQPPQGLEIDRIDNNRGYIPGNCRWATVKQQMANRRSTHWIEYGGMKKTVSQWADYLKMPRRTFSNRLRNGWSVERAINTPARAIPHRRKYRHAT